jgi:hypothetical protein
MRACHRTGDFGMLKYIPSPLVAVSNLVAGPDRCGGWAVEWVGGLLGWLSAGPPSFACPPTEEAHALNVPDKALKAAVLRLPGCAASRVLPAPPPTAVLPAGRSCSGPAPPSTPSGGQLPARRCSRAGCWACRQLCTPPPAAAGGRRNLVGGWRLGVQGSGLLGVQLESPHTPTTFSMCAQLALTDWR